MANPSPKTLKYFDNSNSTPAPYGVNVPFNQENQDVWLGLDLATGQLCVTNFNRTSTLFCFSSTPLNAAKTVYVDGTFGNNDTGLAYRIDKPFKTIKAAEAVAVSGDQIYIYPGTYSGEGNTGMGKSNIKYYFTDGAICNNGNDPLFTDADGGFSVSGRGTFFSSGTICSQTNGTQVNFEAKRVNHSNEETVGIYIGSGSKLYFKADEGSSGGTLFHLEDLFGNESFADILGLNIYSQSGNEYPLFKISATTIDAKMTVHLNETSVTGGGTIAEMHRGGYLEFNAGYIKCANGIGFNFTTGEGGGTGKAFLYGNLFSENSGVNVKTVQITCPDLEVVSYLFIQTGGFGYILDEASTLHILGDVYSHIDDSGVVSHSGVAGSKLIVGPVVIKNQFNSAISNGIVILAADGKTFLHNTTIVTSNAGAESILSSVAATPVNAMPLWNNVAANGNTVITGTQTTNAAFTD
jgi:hypothetical protein